MRYYKQLNAHKPAEGLYGDCFRTVIGCLLDMPPEQVPHWFDGIPEEQEAEHPAWQACHDWLALRGFSLASFPLAFDEDVTVQTVIEYACQWNKNVSMLFWGASVSGTDHVVIIRNGKILHDPSFLDVSVVGPSKRNGIYSLSLLVPLILTTVDEEFKG